MTREYLGWLATHATAAIGETGDPFASQLERSRFREQSRVVDVENSGSACSRSREPKGFSRCSPPMGAHMLEHTVVRNRQPSSHLVVIGPMLSVSADGKIPVTESHSGGVALTAKDRAFDRSCHSPNEIARLPFVSCFLRVASQRSRAASRRHSELAPLEPPPQVGGSSAR